MPEESARSIAIRLIVRLSHLGRSERLTSDLLMDMADALALELPREAMLKSIERIEKLGEQHVKPTEAGLTAIAEINAKLAGE